MTDRPTPREVIDAVDIVGYYHVGEKVLDALADEGYEVVDFKGASIAVGTVIDQRDRAVRALDAIGGHRLYRLANDVLDEDWAKAVLDG